MGKYGNFCLICSISSEILKFPTLDESIFYRNVYVCKSIFLLTGPLFASPWMLPHFSRDEAERDCCFCCLLSSKGLSTPSHSKKRASLGNQDLYMELQRPKTLEAFLSDPSPEAMKTLTGTDTAALRVSWWFLLQEFRCMSSQSWMCKDNWKRLCHRFDSIWFYFLFIHLFIFLRVL